MISHKKARSRQNYDICGLTLLVNTPVQTESLTA